MAALSRIVQGPLRSAREGAASGDPAPRTAAIGVRVAAPGLPLPETAGSEAVLPSAADLSSMAELSDGERGPSLPPGQAAAPAPERLTTGGQDAAQADARSATHSRARMPDVPFAREAAPPGAKLPSAAGSAGPTSPKQAAAASSVGTSVSKQEPAPGLAPPISRSATPGERPRMTGLVAPLVTRDVQQSFPRERVIERVVERTVETRVVTVAPAPRDLPVPAPKAPPAAEPLRWAAPPLALPKALPLVPLPPPVARAPLVPAQGPHREADGSGGRISKPLLPAVPLLPAPLAPASKEAAHDSGENAARPAGPGPGGRATAAENPAQLNLPTALPKPASNDKAAAPRSAPARPRAPQPLRPEAQAARPAPAARREPSPTRPVPPSITISVGRIEIHGNRTPAPRPSVVHVPRSHQIEPSLPLGPFGGRW